MSDYGYGTLASNGSTITLTPTISSGTPKTPPGLIVTAAAQTKRGWLGQVIVDKQIVFETPPFSNADQAIDAANKRVVDAISSLFLALEQ
ncbi:MAG: hypothetical protein JWO67_4492 [Streptosporangiaceae bacterium]|nr:hypothetical protein [Streptosporangiaceae bacterium]